LNESFVLEGYSYKDVVSVEQGDVVLDCGAYIGDSALYFSQRAGKNGKIYSFEPTPDVYSVLLSNVENNEPQNVIYPICAAAGSEKGKASFKTFTGKSEGNRISVTGELEVDVVQLDSFVAEHEIQKVDFIKMDIEGAEGAALKGAERIIRDFHPKLAICIYHRMADHWEIPRQILSINPNYEFYVRHNGKRGSDTVLFCKPTKSPSVVPDIDPKWQVYKDTYLSILDRLMV
jgi:FkbM family methyltransferase